jgi:hypothetical protein
MSGHLGARGASWLTAAQERGTNHGVEIAKLLEAADTQ